MWSRRSTLSMRLAQTRREEVSMQTAMQKAQADKQIHPWIGPSHAPSFNLLCSTHPECYKAPRLPIVPPYCFAIDLLLFRSVRAPSLLNTTGYNQKRSLRLVILLCFGLGKYTSQNTLTHSASSARNSSLKTIPKHQYPLLLRSELLGQPCLGSLHGRPQGRSYVGCHICWSLNSFNLYYTQCEINVLCTICWSLKSSKLQ